MSIIVTVDLGNGNRQSVRIESTATELTPRIARDAQVSAFGRYSWCTVTATGADGVQKSYRVTGKTCRLLHSI